MPTIAAVTVAGLYRHTLQDRGRRLIGLVPNRLLPDPSQKHAA